MHFSLALEDGTQAISTFEEDPLDFQMGDGTLQPGLELGLFGLRAGDKQTLTLTPDQAYDWHDEQMIQHMPLSDFAGKIDPEAGQLVAFSTAEGDEAPGIVLAVEDEQVKVDFNHPLAGHNVVYRVEILSVADPVQP
jgi:FKBP-type peptidyl-prolyl cis-trans isomerase SlpA